MGTVWKAMSSYVIQAVSILIKNGFLFVLVSLGRWRCPLRHEKVDFGWEKLSREMRGILIKGFLKEQGLTPPETIGNIDEGTAEILGISDIYWNGGYFADIEFQVQFKKDAPAAPFVMRSNKGGAGAVFVPIIDGKFALVKQWRPTLGHYTWEIPRGFSSEWETGKKLGASAIPKTFATVLGELAEEVGKAKDIVPTLLGEIAENSGTNTTSPSYWMLKIGSIALGGTEEGLTVKLVEPAEAKRLVGSEIFDSHSVTALFLTLRALGV
jgi:hypothetical protein